MGKIYAPPTELEHVADCSKGWQEREQEYIDKVKAYCKKFNSGEFVGEQIDFQVADGYASYIVASLKPVILIHLPIGDAYQAPYVERMTAKDIKWEIGRGKKLAELFGN